MGEVDEYFLYDPEEVKRLNAPYWAWQLANSREHLERCFYNGSVDRQSNL